MTPDNTAPGGAKFDPIRAALLVMLHEAQKFNATVMREAGVGPFDLVAIRQAEAALARPTPVVAAPETSQAMQQAAEPAVSERVQKLRNLQTWLVCREIGNALQPELKTVRDWLEALGAITGESAPEFINAAADNQNCKFASGGARCISHCGDAVCLAASPAPRATADFVMVPREPTHEMIFATPNGNTSVAEIYRAMIAAAPSCLRS